MALHDRMLLENRLGHSDLISGSDGLADFIGTQLTTLCEKSSLPKNVRYKLRHTFTALTAESLRQDILRPFSGLSYINADGLPFQWVFHATKTGIDFGFLCEVGVPGDTPLRRYALSRERLLQVCEPSGSSLRWLDQAMNIVMPSEDEPWPSLWRSAMWIGVAPTQKGILLKPYFNLNRGSARDRWMRVGRLLQSLGRDFSLAAFCEVSGQVSQDSWPVGLAMDVLPGGAPGRIKVYFRSEAVTLDWLERWYRAANCMAHAPLARRFLDLFPWLSRKPYPNAAFTVSLEFHPGSEDLSLKTDLAVTKWISSDEQILLGTKSLIQEIGGCTAELDGWLQAVGASPADPTSSSSFRFVGLGHEPQGTSHVNVYLEPRMEQKVCDRHPVPLKSPKDAVRTALDFLLSSRSGGHWADFDLPVGKSDAWVTAYTLAQLARLHRAFWTADVTQAINEALQWLVESHSPNGGWGYNKTVPDDADSTSWAILALQHHRRPVPSSARKFLLGCRDHTGAFATYPAGSAPCPGWALGMPDVTASSLYALGTPWDLAAELRFARWQRSDGTIPSYWWASPFYTLALMLDWAPELAIEPFVLQHVDHLDSAEAQNSFDKALLLSCLTALHRPRTQQLASSLCQEQNSDGSWRPSALLRLPTFGVEMPWTTIDSGSLFCDQNAIFTTATAISALRSAL